MYLKCVAFIILTFVSNNVLGQVSIDSLMHIRKALLYEKQKIESRIDSLDQLVLDLVEKDGIKVKLEKLSYTKKIYKGTHSSEVLTTVSNGDELTFYEKDFIYYRVKTGSIEGYIFLNDDEVSYPVNLLGKKSKTKKLVNKSRSEPVKNFVCEFNATLILRYKI